MLRILRKCFHSYASVCGACSQNQGLTNAASHFFKKRSLYTDQSKDEKDVKHSYEETMTAHAFRGPPPGVGGFPAIGR